MARPPTSLLLLIDRRNRLEGELNRLAQLKREAADLHRHIKRALDEVDGDLTKHRIQIDRSILEAQTTYAKRAEDYGFMTTHLFRALKSAPDDGMTSGEIAAAIDASWPANVERPTDWADFRERLRKRLRALRASGALLSPWVGNGRTSHTTWIINPDRWSAAAPD